MSSTSVSSRWPALPVAEWKGTRDSLQLYTQIVGKIRLANTPLINHWWNTTLYVTTRGLTTSLMPHPSGAAFQIDFDFHRSQVEISTTSGDTRSAVLTARPVAAFYADMVDKLAELGLATDIWPMPVEIAGAVPFAEDTLHATYEPAQARRFWLALVEADRVFSTFRGRFIAKSSPVHLFWGALDLAVTRFSGRTAPPHPGGAPNCGPQVMAEGYSHELSSAGYWPGGGEGLFYSYAYPEPEGFREFPVATPGASYSTELGEYVLPYSQVRAASNPDGLLLDFLQSTYEAAAVCGRWDRDALERDGSD